jgi:hypothetical protein
MGDWRLAVVIVVWAGLGFWAQAAAGFLIGEARVFRQWWEWPVRGLAFLTCPVWAAVVVLLLVANITIRPVVHVYRLARGGDHA